MPNGHHHTASSADMRQRHAASSSGALQTSLSIVRHVHHTLPVHVLSTSIHHRVFNVSILRSMVLDPVPLGAAQAAAWLVDLQPGKHLLN